LSSARSTGRARCKGKRVGWYFAMNYFLHGDGDRSSFLGYDSVSFSVALVDMGGRG
jgi:hypothetical protein